jgi:ribosomal protein L11 methylase PrmA
MAPLYKNLGSFRDPAGNIYHYENRILRTINPVAEKQYQFLKDSDLITKSVDAGFLIRTKELTSDEIPKPLRDSKYLVEHDVIPHISYPYEWSFFQLKAAALHHLDFQLFLLDKGAVLTDATAYNVQFIGSKPIFIDLLSIAKYKEGQFWNAHSQFCEQFLNPLLLQSNKGIVHNYWYRGRLEGISTSDLSALLSFTEKFSWNIFTHIVLQAKFERDALAKPARATSKIKSAGKLSKLGYKSLLLQLRKWIRKLEPKVNVRTVWEKYSITNTYNDDEATKKRNVVIEFSNNNKPEKLIDLGCNSGDYSFAALEGGAKTVIGYDFDQKAVDAAFLRSQNNDANYLPLWLDAANPSPSQGWMEKERCSFSTRNKADAVIALAFEHHLAIGKNIPLDEVVSWIISLAPVGLIEFVPKNDETVKTMLAIREDIFPNYTQLSFEKSIQKVAEIVTHTIISNSGRIIYEYKL